MSSIAKMISITQLENLNFVIPTYQRGFRWNRQQISELLNDLHDFIQKNDLRNIYSLQPIVVKKKEENTFEVIDGQQRLTAIWILYRLRAIFRGNDGLSAVYYNLIYEEKPEYQCLLNSFKQIIDDCLSDTERKADALLLKAFNGLKNGNLSTCDNTLFKTIDIVEFKDIDSINFFNIVDYLIQNTDKKGYSRNFNSSVLNSATVINDIFRAIGLNEDKDVQFIWDEMEDENVIEKFSNVNANKIPLSEAELIKAYILNRVSDGISVAHKWESIERGLKDEKFWSFFINETDKYASRIQALFEIWVYFISNSDVLNSSRAHVLSSTVMDFIDKGQNNAEELWKSVCEIYDILCDWYQDYYFYHAIGTLILLNKDKKNIKDVASIFKKYKEIPKQEFKCWVKIQICSSPDFSYFFNDENEKLRKFDDLNEEILHSYLVELDYDINKKRIKAMLLVYNIALLINSNNEYERFPFDRFKAAKGWDIEHVNARSKQSNVCDGISVEIARDIYDPNKEYAHFNDEEFAKKIDALYSINKIGNLVLLDPKTNRGYKDKPFLEKRKIIIQVMRNDDKGENEVILPGTRWVFLKEGSNTMIDKWQCPTDYDLYINNISNNIINMFKTDSSKYWNKILDKEKK